jgi:hypothetical protein
MVETISNLDESHASPSGESGDGPMHLYVGFPFIPPHLRVRSTLFVVVVMPSACFYLSIDMSKMIGGDTILFALCITL